MRIRVWALVGLGLLAGCAAEGWIYSKSGVTPVRLNQDLEACRRQSTRPERFALTREGRLDQDAIRDCMTRKGYTSRPNE